MYVYVLSSLVFFSLPPAQTIAPYLLLFVLTVMYSSYSLKRPYLSSASYLLSFLPRCFAFTSRFVSFYLVTNHYSYLEDTYSL